MNLKNTILILLVIILTIITVLPLFNKGFFEFHDNTTVVRINEMEKSLTSGMFPVRWVDSLGYGFGYPIFNFYAPFPYYVGASIVKLGFGGLVATKMTLFIGMIISGITMFFLTRKFFGNTSALVSSVIYSYFPYHAINLYVRGAVGEIFAYAFLPIIFLGLFSLINIKEKKISLNKFFSLPLVIGIFLVAISHNLTLFMTLLILVLVPIIILLLSNNKKASLIQIISSVILGCALSSFYIIPAILEMGYTNVRSQVGGGADFNDHFVCIGQFWESSWGFGGSVPGCLDGLSFRFGKANILFAVLAILMLGYSIFKKKFRDVEKVTFVSFVVLIISLILTINLSKPIWEKVVFMEYIQYPWRFMNFASLGMSLLIAYLVYIVGKNFSKKAGLILAAFLIILTIYTNAKLFQPKEFNNYTDTYYSQKNYVSFKVSKISDEYMPEGFSKPINITQLPTEKLTIMGGGSVRLITDMPNKLTAQYKNKNASKLHINKAYFPFWIAKVNNREVPLIPVKNGMELNLPSGKGQVEIVLRQTAIEKASNVISVLAFIIMLTAIMLQKSYGKKTT